MPPTLSAIRRIDDPKRRASKAAEIVTARVAALDEAFSVRDEACRVLLRAGTSAAEVARLIGTTRQNVAKRFPDEVTRARL